MKHFLEGLHVFREHGQFLHDGFLFLAFDHGVDFPGLFAGLE